MSQSTETARQIAVNLDEALLRLAEAAANLRSAYGFAVAENPKDENLHLTKIKNMIGTISVLSYPLSSAAVEWEGNYRAHERRDDQIRDGIAEMTGK